MKAQEFILDDKDQHGHEVKLRRHGTYEAIVVWGCQEVPILKGNRVVSNLEALEPFEETWFCVRASGERRYYARLVDGTLHAAIDNPGTDTYQCDWEDFRAAYVAVATLDQEEGKG